MKTHGPIRTSIENLKTLAQQAGLTLEQVADFMDVVAAIQKTTVPSDATATSTEPVPLKDVKGVH